MNLREEFSRLKRYITFLIIATVIGLTILGTGIYLGGITVANRLILKGASMRTILWMAGPGIALQVLGVFMWSLGFVAALYWVLYEQFSATMHRNIESVDLEASIRSVVGDRVDDIQTEITEMRRTLEQEHQRRRK